MSIVYVSLYFSNATAGGYKTRLQTPEQKRHFFPISFGPSTLSKVAIVGSIVSVHRGIAFAQSEVITGFPIDLIGRLAALSDPGKAERGPI